MRPQYVFALLLGLLPRASGWALAEATATTPTAQEAFSLAQYLDQVDANSLSLKAYRAAIRSAGLQAREAETVFSPFFNAEVSRYDSQAQNSNPALMGNRTLDSYWNAGLSKKWGTGTLTSLSFRNDLSQVQYPGGGIFSSLISSEPYYTAVPTLTLSQPLWRDFMANASNATVNKVKYGALSGASMTRYQLQQTFFSAESAYITVWVARQALDIQVESLERKRKIMVWTQRRVANNLTDESDGLQSEAGVRQLELSIAAVQEELENAERQFNLLRQQPTDTVVEPLVDLTLPVVEVEQKAVRADVQAAAFDALSKKAALDDVSQRYTPEISLYGSASLTGREGDNPSSWQTAFSRDYPVTTVGLKVSADLDMGLIADADQGARLALQSSQQDLEQKRLSLEKDWRSLKRRWESLNQRLLLSTELVELQRKKAEREKVRYDHGRTTNYLVLQYEDDYRQSQVQRLRLLAETCLVAAQVRLYNGIWQ